VHAQVLEVDQVVQREAVLEAQHGAHDEVGNNVRCDAHPGAAMTPAKWFNTNL
jgi:hypothetical protein